MTKDKQDIPDEESLEDIVELEISEEEGIENIMDDGLEVVSDVDTVGIAVQLANSTTQDTARMLESSDIEQDGVGESLEETLNREWRPEDENKQGGNLYSGKKDDDSYVIEAKSKTGQVDNLTLYYQEQQKGLSAHGYESSSPQGSGAQFGEIQGERRSNIDVFDSSIKPDADSFRVKDPNESYQH